MADIELTITVDEDAARHVAEFHWGSPKLRRIALAIAAALPKPRPAEPMGLGAVVRDGNGLVWVRTRASYQPFVLTCGGGVMTFDYADIQDPIEVLSEGVIL